MSQDDHSTQVDKMKDVSNYRSDVGLVKDVLAWVVVGIAALLYINMSGDPQVQSAIHQIYRLNECILLGLLAIIIKL